MNKSTLLFIASLFILAASGFVFLSANQSQQVKPEMPIMQQFSATPRFDHHQTLFGQQYDLSRFDLHERYERELTNICYTHNNTLQTLKRANRYFPILEPILREEGVPTDFLYLCCIESSLNTRAKSPAGACGLWQFMPDTGRQYGLIINDEVDERYNTVKSTHAACRYFKDAYKKFGDWMAVAAAYNGGMAGLQRKLTAQKETLPMDILLPEETSRYMFRIMAFKELFADPYRFGFVLYSDQLYRPIRTEVISVTSSIASITDFAKRHGTSYYHLKEFNPWLRADKLTVRPGTTYKIEIPVAEDLYYDASRPFAVYDIKWVVDR